MTLDNHFINLVGVKCARFDINADFVLVTIPILEHISAAAAFKISVRNVDFRTLCHLENGTFFHAFCAAARLPAGTRCQAVTPRQKRASNHGYLTVFACYDHRAVNLTPGITIIAIFIIVVILSYIEDYLGKYKLPLYLLIGFTLILLAGLREVGIDPDSQNYEISFQRYYDSSAQERVEYSYTFISMLLNFITDDVHILFLFYAFWGLTLKFVAFRKYSAQWFLPLVVYLAYYYELHEVTQIRTGILSGCLLLAIKPIAEGKRKIALCILLIGSIFHISGLMLLPLVFLSNKPMSTKEKIIWASLIPISYVIYFAGANLIVNTNLPYIGDKLALYQKGVEKGLISVSVNVFSPMQMFSVMLYYYLLFFHDTLVKFNKYFVVMMKILTLGLFCFAAFAILPVMAQRVCYLFSIVNVILYTNICYTIKQKWIGITLVSLISLIILNYGLGYINFPFLWKIG